MNPRLICTTLSLLAAVGFSAAAHAAAPKGITLKLTVNGVARTALVFPGKDAANAPLPLVFIFHGFGSGAGGTEGGSGNGFQNAWPEATVVYPESLTVTLRSGDVGPGWQQAPGDNGDRDLHFVDALYESLSTTYKVDARRVYAAGFSNGAWFTYVLLTAEPERFAAFVPIDACLELFLKWATTPRPALVITDSGGCGGSLLYEQQQLVWMRHLNECGNQVTDWAPGYHSFRPSGTGQPVVWYRHTGPHQWPSEVNPSIALFFQDNPLPDRPSTPPAVAPATDTSGSEGVVAGTGSAGRSGYNGPATAAALHYPEGIALDAGGNLAISDTLNCVIDRVLTDGTIQLVAGDGLLDLTLGASSDGHIARTVHLSFPQGIAVDNQGNLLIADNYGARVRKVSPTGTVMTVSGNGLDGQTDGRAAIQTELYFPTAVAVDAAGNLFIADTGNQRIRKVDTSGTINTLAGTGVEGYGGDGGPATSAQLDEPRGLALDGKGNLFVADSYNNRIRKIDTAGIITTVVGTGTAGFAGDGGPATAAQLNTPEGVAVDSAGNLFIADSANHCVRKVTSDGTITTVAGGSGGAVVGVPLSYPEGLAIDRAGTLYVADPLDQRVRKVTGVAAPGLLAGQAFPNP